MGEQTYRTRLHSLSTPLTEGGPQILDAFALSATLESGACLVVTTSLVKLYDENSVKRKLKMQNVSGNSILLTTSVLGSIFLPSEVLDCSQEWVAVDYRVF